MWRRCLSVAGFAAAVLGGGALNAQPGFDWHPYLKRDQIEVVGEKFAWQRLDRCELRQAGRAPSVSYIGWSAEAPRDAESRDAFAFINASAVQYYLAEQTIIRDLLGLKVAESLVCEPTDAKPGSPHRHLHFAHRPNGLTRIETLDTRPVPVIVNLTWGQLFAGEALPAPDLDPAPIGAPKAAAPGVKAQASARPTDWSQHWKQDQVTQKGPNLIWQQFERCEMRRGPQAGKTFHLAWSARARRVYLSRDAFAHLNALGRAQALSLLAAPAAGTSVLPVQVLACVPSSQPMGLPFGTVHFEYGPMGVQRTETTPAGQEDQQVLSWGQLLGGEGGLGDTVLPPPAP